MSVFAHTLPDECENYAREIMRASAGWPRCRVGVPSRRWVRHVAVDVQPSGARHVGAVPRSPRKAVSQDRQVLERWFGQPADHRLLGTWRGTMQAVIVTNKDWLIWD
jgi:hypothetical protein